jgi:hypothetical protein
MSALDGVVIGIDLAGTVGLSGLLAAGPSALGVR